MREKELEYLRSELNQRLNFSYEHSHKLFGHIMLVWGGTLVLLGNTKKDSVVDLGYVLFIMATVFFISVVALYFLSQRNSDNMKEISKLAAYIAVFYEESPILKNKYEKRDKIFWELATLEINKKDMGKSQWGKLRNKLKNEYFWLSLMATVVITVVFFIMDGSFKKKGDISFDYYIWMFWGCIGYMAISALLSFITFNQLSLNWEEWDDKKKDYSKSFLKYAKETGYYTDDYIIERFGEKFCKDIKYKQAKKSGAVSVFAQTSEFVNLRGFTASTS